MNNHARIAVEHFGITANLALAGYLTTSGEFLNFSGGGYMRDMDHRDIADVYEMCNESADGLVAFLAEGNIRVMPECPGLEMTTIPTPEQWVGIHRFWARFRRDGMFIDISRPGSCDVINTLFFSPFTSFVEVEQEIIESLNQR